MIGRMKKVFAFVLALLMVFAASLALAETAREDYIGNWTLYSFKLNGQSYPASALGMETIINIHADDTATYSMDDRFCVSPVTYTATGASFEAPMVTVKLTMNAAGMLVADVGLEEMTLVMTMERAPETALPAEVTAVLGQWNGVQVTENGVLQNGMIEKGLVLTVYDDGYAMLSISGSTIGAKLVVEDGTLYMADDAQGQYPLRFDAQGQMIIEMADSGIVLTMARADAAAPAETAAESPFGALYGKLMQVTAKQTGGLTGVWNLAGVTLNDMWIPADETGLYVKLVVQDGVDTLYYGNEVIEREATVTADSVTISGIRFALSDKGQLIYTLEEDGTVLAVHLERAEEAPPAAAAAGLDGVWKATEVDFDGYTVSATEAGAHVTLTIAGTRGTLDYGDESYTSEITVEGGSVTMVQGEDVLVFALNEKGQLCITIMDGQSAITWRLEKQAD